MRVLRIIVAGLIAVGAMVAVLFAALVVFFTGLAAYALQLFRKHPEADRSGPAQNRPMTMRTDDAIDVVSTRVPDETAKH